MYPWSTGEVYGNVLLGNKNIIVVILHESYIRTINYPASSLTSYRSFGYLLCQLAGLLSQLQGGGS